MSKIFYDRVKHTKSIPLLRVSNFSLQGSRWISDIQEIYEIMQSIEKITSLTAFTDK